MSQEVKINPATGYVHDDSQLENKPAVIAEPIEVAQEEKQEASE